MIAITEHADGCVLAVRAQPGARKTAVLGEYQGALKISVTSVAEAGCANQALIELLCLALGLKRSRVELLRGKTSRHKWFLIRGLKKGDLAARLPLGHEH